MTSLAEMASPEVSVTPETQSSVLVMLATGESSRRVAPCFVATSAKTVPERPHAADHLSRTRLAQVLPRDAMEIAVDRVG